MPAVIAVAVAATTMSMTAKSPGSNRGFHGATSDSSVHTTMTTAGAHHRHVPRVRLMRTDPRNTMTTTAAVTMSRRNFVST
ncbi:hypothetical protein [Salana multivorans]